jgi:chemotaxis protein MotB
MDSARPIIIVKKKTGHGGHHGGAWKVAYADFVTAMMALFIVLWLMNTNKPVREAIAGYFQDPSGKLNQTDSSHSSATENPVLANDNITALKTKLQKTIEQMKDFDKFKDQIVITVTPEGLRVELLETQSGTFFDLGSAELNQNGQKLLLLLAQELGKVPNKITIEGHTDAKPFTGKRDYSNWELSTDRANSARRLMQQDLRPGQVSQVRGYANEKLRDPAHPLDPSNRRISIIVHYLKDQPNETTVQSSGTFGLPVSLQSQKH